MRFHYFKLLITLNSIFIFSCESSSKTNTLINWDTYGVPHIVSSTKKDLFFDKASIKPAAVALITATLWKIERESFRILGKKIY